MRRLLAPVLFAALVLATIAAFAQAQRVKHRNLLLDRVRLTRDFSPNGDGRKDAAYIRFRLTRPDRADVEIVDERGFVVRTLATNRPLPDYFYLSFVWDGRTDTGRPAPAGTYQLGVRLIGQDRDLVPPDRVMNLRKLSPNAAGPSRTKR